MNESTNFQTTLEKKESHAMKKINGIACVALLTLAMMTSTSGVAVASKAPSYALGHAKHCRTGYMKRTEKHQVDHRATRYVACVLVQKTLSLIPAPTPTPAHPVTVSDSSSPAQPKAVILGAVDPTFVQSAKDPLNVTFQYSASASQRVGDVVEQAVSLPTGVLELFTATTPGAPVGLACAMNVGDDIVGGECNVQYQDSGTFAITTVYLSGTSSATDTEPITVKPYGTSIMSTSVASGSSTITAPDGTTCTPGPARGCFLLTATVSGDGDVSVPPVGTLTFGVYDNNGAVLAKFAPKTAGQTYCLIVWASNVSTSATSPDCTGSGTENNLVIGFQYAATFSQTGYTPSTTGIRS